MHNGYMLVNNEYEEEAPVLPLPFAHIGEVDARPIRNPESF